MLGDYDDEDDATVLSVSASMAASVVNVDLPLDVRDLSYDLTHWGEGDHFFRTLALDAVALLPVIGIAKHAKHIDEAMDAAKIGADILDDASDVAKVADDAADIADEAGDIAKVVDDAADAADIAGDATKHVDEVSDVAKSMDTLSDAADISADLLKSWGNIETVEDAVKEVDKAVNAVSDVSDSAKDVANTIDNAHDVEKDVEILTTRNKRYLNMVHPETHVPYLKQTVKLSNGKTVIGVFPKFDSFADIELPKELWKESFSNQKKYLIQKLAELTDSVTGNPEIRKLFSEDQLEDIASEIPLEGFTWHHNEQEGLMQLVNTSIHDATKHTGGMSIWGIGY